MEEMPRRDTVPNTPKRPTTPLEQMEEDGMHRLHPAFPSNTDLIAAGNNGIELTKEQHRILTSQSEGTTFLYNVPENRQQVEGSVKLELRYPIIQVIRSQWESQDLPAYGQSVPCDR